MELICFLVLLVCSIVVFCSSWKNLYQKIPNRGVVRLFVKCVLCLISSAAIALAYQGLLIMLFEWLGMVTLVGEQVTFLSYAPWFLGLHLPYWLSRWIFSRASSSHATPDAPVNYRPDPQHTVWSAQALISRDLGGNRAVARRARQGWTGSRH